MSEFSQHAISPLREGTPTKKPQASASGLKDRAPSRERRNLRGMGGYPGLRPFSRSQWRDRGRFARPSPLPLPAKM